MLLERGALIDGRGDNDWTALHNAAIHNRIEVARLLLEHGADVNAHGQYDHGGTPSQFGLVNGYHAIVELLSAYGAESVNSSRVSDVFTEY